MLAIEGQQPRFENWQVNWEFGEAIAPSEAGPVPAEASRPEPACEGRAEGAECWRGLASHPECYLWVNHYTEDWTGGTWTGSCSGGLASGAGTVKWVRGSEEQNGTGLFQDDKQEGRWVERSADGTVMEGSYTDGERNGHWVLRSPSGSVWAGPYADGERNGRWAKHTSDQRELGYIIWDHGRIVE